MYCELRSYVLGRQAERMNNNLNELHSIHNLIISRGGENNERQRKLIVEVSSSLSCHHRHDLTVSKTSSSNDLFGFFGSCHHYLPIGNRSLPNPHLPLLATSINRLPSSARIEMASLIQLWRFWIFQVMVTNTTNAFYLSMVGSTSDVTSRGSTNHIGNSNNIRRLSKTSISQTTNSAAQSFDLSSGLISQLAVVAIRSRLRSHTNVACDVTARNNGLIFGSFFVGPCTVKGTGWQSGLGLTCRAIEATVAECELDKSRVVADRKLVLKQPCTSTAFSLHRRAFFLTTSLKRKYY